MGIEKLWSTDSIFLNTEIEYVIERMHISMSNKDYEARQYWQGRLDSLANIERARKQGAM
jgi:hypothetical protein